MKKQLFLWAFLCALISLNAQVQIIPGQIKGKAAKHDVYAKHVQKRGTSNPSTCGTDTSTFTDLSSTGYPLIALGNGQLVGQFFGAPQEITVKGFRFFAYTPWDTSAKIKFRNVYAKIYSAGPDSLPRGAALDSVLIRVDTVTGSLTFAKMAKDAVFKKPVVVTSGYVLTVECFETTNIPAIVTNSWTNADGEGRNLSSIQLNNRWYKGSALSVAGVAFNAHFQMFPFVTYKYGADFTIKDDCYMLLDSFSFINQYQKTVAGSVFYNNYMYYANSGFDALCHTWTYDNTSKQLEKIDGKFRPGSKKNVKIKLTSFSVPYSLNVDYCYDSTEKTLYYKPNTPAITSSMDGCVGQNLTLNITANSDITNRWFKKQTDATAFNTGNTYTLNNLAKNDTFFITGQNGPCFSRSYTAFITANQTPSRLDILNDSVCSDANAILKASTDAGNILWYKTATGGTPVLTASELVTGKLISDTTYYAEANNKGCLLSTGRKAVKAFVNADFAPAKPTGASDTSVCYSGSNMEVTLKAFTSSSASIRWFDVTTGGTPVSSTSEFKYIITGRGSKSFYVESWDGRCGSGRLPIVVKVGAVPNTFAKVSDEICLGDSADIAASASWGDVRWFATKQSTKHYATGKFIRAGGFTNPRSYAYYKTIDGICEKSTFDSIEILVNIPPTATIVKANNVCNGEKASIQLATTQGNVIWYFDNAATAPIFTGNTLNLGEIYSNTTRYYETELNGCKSVRNAITVKALDKPAAGFQFVVEFPKKLTCTPLNTNNMNILWNFGDGKTSTDDIGVNTYATEGQYTVKMAATSTLSGCKDSVSVNITVNHNQIESAKMSLGVYPNPVAAGNQVFSQTPVETATWYDLSGRLLAQETNTPQTTNTPGLWKSTIEVPAHLRNGIYLLQLQAQGTTQTIKIQVD